MKLSELLLKPPQLHELRNRPKISQFNSSKTRSRDSTMRDVRKTERLNKLWPPLRKLSASREKKRLKQDVFRLSEKPNRRKLKLRSPDRRLRLLENKPSSQPRKRETSPLLRKLPEKELLLPRPLKLLETKPSLMRLPLERPRMPDLPPR